MATRTSQDNDYTAFNDPAGYVKKVFSGTEENSDSISSFLLKCLAKHYSGLEVRAAT